MYEVKPFVTKPNMAVSADYYWSAYKNVMWWMPHEPNHPDGWNVVYANHSVQWVPAGDGYNPKMGEQAVNYYINLGKISF